MNTNFDPSNRRLPGEKSVVAQILTVIVGLVVLTAAFMFSLVFFAVLAVVGLILWAYLWWKTRDLRQRMREQMQQQMDEMRDGMQDGMRDGMREGPATASRPRNPEAGDVIEGEAVRVDDERSQQGQRNQHTPPRE